MTAVLNAVVAASLSATGGNTSAWLCVMSAAKFASVVHTGLGQYTVKLSKSLFWRRRDKHALDALDGRINIVACSPSSETLI